MSDKNSLGLLKSLITVLIGPVVLLLAWPISFVGTKIGRTRGNALELPIKFYEHPETKRRVILVGVIHIAKAPYYQDIQHLIDSAAAGGYRILYESVGKMDEADIINLPDNERSVVRQMQAVSAFMQGMSTKLFDGDIVYQKQGLTYPPSWIRTDVEVAHVATLFAEANLTFFAGGEKAAKQNPLEDMSEEHLKWMRLLVKTLIKLLPGITAVLRPFTYFSYKKRVRNYIIIDLRDEVAAEGILHHTKESDVLSVWGAAHLPGIHTHLSAAGYRLKNTHWLKAFW